MPNNTSADILLVEDNPGDIILITEALKDTPVLHRLNIVRDGMEAIEFLHKKGAYERAPRPVLVILDLNLPCKDGREVLELIKSDPVLKRIPVIVFSGSNSPSDIISSYDHCANCYLVKPINLESYRTRVHSILDFWLNQVSLPPDI